MSDAPAYADFYVAVATIVPIVLTGQLVLMRFLGNGRARPRGVRVLQVLWHVSTASLAVLTIIVALLVLAGFSPDSLRIRALLVVTASSQVTLGLLGAVAEALYRPPEASGIVLQRILDQLGSGGAR